MGDRCKRLLRATCAMRNAANSRTQTSNKPTQRTSRMMRPQVKKSGSFFEERATVPCAGEPLACSRAFAIRGLGGAPGSPLLRGTAARAPRRWRVRPECPSNVLRPGYREEGPACVLCGLPTPSRLHPPPRAREPRR
eukprot:scaffold10412_cov107-Isochrysis_galbana.AAC.11